MHNPAVISPSSPPTRDEIAIADHIEAAAWRSMFALAPPPMGLVAERLAGGTALIAPSIPVSLMNRVIGLGVDEPVSGSALDAIVARYRAAGSKSFWVHVSPIGEEARLVTELEARGFALASRPTWAKVLRGTEPPPEIETPFALREVHPDRALELAHVLLAAHGMPPAMAPWTAAMVGAGGFRAFAAFDAADAIVAGGFLYQDRMGAWLGLGGTAASHRRRGAQGALMTLRIREAIAAGATHIATETGEPMNDEPNPSLANMYRVGFRCVASRRNFALG
ncbi:MAG: hypothetical protein U0414_28680 [Polyangiaceae bacterium]